MESFGTFLDSESLLATEFFSNDVQIPSSFLAENMYHMDDSIFFTDFSCVPHDQESGNCFEFDCAFILDHGYGINNVNHVNGVDFLHDESILFYPMDRENEPVFPDDMMEEIMQLSNAGRIQAIVSGDHHSSEEMQLKRKYETTRIQIDRDKGYQLQSLEDKSEDNSPQSPKKRSRVSKDQNKRNTRSKKDKKLVNIPISNDTDQEENINNAAVTNGQSSSSFSSEDDHSNASQDHDGASNSKGKARANRGSATDPQSLYARRRRERINERLRILQNLVPNGTKVDISTMLEEAVHYVKFLQNQIKLLSSDELWMYAPIAYNGMNIGLYDKISPNLWS